MYDTRTLALLAPRAGEVHLDREATQLADLRVALTRCTARSESAIERLQAALFGRSQDSDGDCDCAD